MGYLVKLQAPVSQLGVANRVSWPGTLQGDMKWGAFYAAEVFCVPSHQQNFGIVGAEALSCGKPVLINNKVNIWRKIEADDAGLVASDTLARRHSFFARWPAKSSDEFTTMQAITVRCFQNRFHVNWSAERLLELFWESR